jgi:transcriptional regulator of NAD metabolism
MTGPESSVPRPAGAPRRAALLALLRSAPGPVAGDALAEHFGISRQAIVHDIAVLRAEGAPVVATVRGYLLARESDRLPFRAVVAVRHTPEQTVDELMAIVDLGVRVRDVVVQHPVYGELRGELELGSPADVRHWAESTRRTGARFLSELTEGVHLHTLEAATEADLAAARQALADRGFLLEDQDPAS